MENKFDLAVEVVEELMDEDTKQEIKKEQKEILEKEDKKTVVIELKPEEYGIFIENEAHLVGDMNDWI